MWGNEGIAQRFLTSALERVHNTKHQNICIYHRITHNTHSEKSKYSLTRFSTAKHEEIFPSDLESLPRSAQHGVGIEARRILRSKTRNVINICEMENRYDITIHLSKSF